MKRSVGYIVKISVLLILIGISYFGIIIINNTFFDFKPKNETEQSYQATEIIIKDTFKIVTWNIGYAGLGKEMDFFYEGGTRMRPANSQVNQYLNGITDFIKTADSVDFFMLQEVDFDSHRSYGIEEDHILKMNKPIFFISKTENYKVPFIPFPLFNPTGKVDAGLVTLSRYAPVKMVRVSYPTNYSWPKSVFFLDRCFMVSIFNLKKKGKKLFIVNTHNSAFDDAKDLRQRELSYLKSYAEKWYDEGNYVVIGGDWNINPKGFKEKHFVNGDKLRLSEENTFEFSKGWKCVYDKSVPSNRDVNVPYSKSVTNTTILDYFYVSPNIEPESVKTLDFGFKNSDHNPVYLNVFFKE